MPSNYYVSYEPGYDAMVHDALVYGRAIDSRYGPTRELGPVSFDFVAGDLVNRAKLNRNIGWMELLQLLAGVYDPDALARVAPRSNLGLFTAPMAYGPRVRDQVVPLLRALERDPMTRQAVLFVGNPGDGPTSNQPCTTAIQFLRRNGRLNAVVTMRSWDLLKGLPYDTVMFGGLTMALATCLGLEAGHIRVNAACPHVYLADVEAGRLPRTRPGRFGLSLDTRGCVDPENRWWWLRGDAEQAVRDATEERVGADLIVLGKAT